MVDESAAEREWALLDQVDPRVREVLAAADVWDAYSEAGYVSWFFVDHMTWMPHGGRLYATWAEICDLFEIGDTPLEAADDVLRRAAALWLTRPEQLDPGFLVTWLERTKAAIAHVARPLRP